MTVCVINYLLHLETSISLAPWTAKVCTPLFTTNTTSSALCSAEEYPKIDLLRVTLCQSKLAKHLGGLTSLEVRKLMPRCPWT